MTFIHQFIAGARFHALHHMQKETSGDIAQLEERKDIEQKVTGSNPLCATVFRPTISAC